MNNSSNPFSVFNDSSKVDVITGETGSHIIMDDKIMDIDLNTLIGNQVSVPASSGRTIYRSLGFEPFSVLSYYDKKQKASRLTSLCVGAGKSALTQNMIKACLAVSSNKE